ncbi:hypothetical protein MTO96_007238 [Rhipicephalus appendiculatus]
MLYECYGSGETVEPPSAVNMATLMDGTQRQNNLIQATFWYETRGQLDSYVTGTNTLEYDPLTDTILFQTNGVAGQFEVLFPPFNGAAYYLKTIITSENNRVVYKVLDTSGTCVNAATLVFKTCYDVRYDCCKQGDSCRDQGVSLSRPRPDFGCPLLQYSRYPEAEPYPLCADYHSCT